jgi:hypothetical protein
MVKNCPNSTLRGGLENWEMLIGLLAVLAGIGTEPASKSKMKSAGL